MDFRIRPATPDDLHHLLHHRRSMFEEMGFQDPAVLARVDEFSREYFSVALPSGAYKGWLAEDPNGQVLGGGGIVLAVWPGYPGESHAKRAWILNMYTEPAACRPPLRRGETAGPSDARLVPQRTIPRRLASRQLCRPPRV